ncbi:2-C-methyl-D-erythritol 4-phosphate cytidylyltransferase [Robbsia sp. Bb-Pol-6]|uniref:2-C-methyl-D-erythritol 4-phosphate cytidylyltransferase n=1 Tax=Robbsia betulipollinis TaxID=2981849 RepID=A0ABT3ZNN3_9BURK|nr:2-C-methyl-D-erythritol 4-phosphate cytidylyltransferase [Robbsia betulipollinis]MCY0388153.1 2-C-methyl-D-erythritol 4-phosphate cytidylyltransferase [Robbsia betulipollinis]
MAQELRVNDRLFALIPCAGSGMRAGGGLPKQYRTVAGRNLLHHTLAAFDACSEFAQTLVVLAADDTGFDPRRFTGLRYAVRRCGGASRQVSVQNGLLTLMREFGARDTDWVLVHDAARPGITPGLIRALIAAVSGDAIGGIVALPVADTIKRSAPAGDPGDPGGAPGTGSKIGNAAGSDSVPRIRATESRDHLWLAQTPQMFRLGLLRGALDTAARNGSVVTDEASAIEALGHAPLLVRGNLRNFKVTYPEDFELAESVLGGADKDRK